MFNFIIAKAASVLSDAKTRFTSLFNTITDKIAFVVLSIKYNLTAIYNSCIAFFSYLYVSLYAPACANSQLFKKLRNQGKNSYKLARAVCRYHSLHQQLGNDFYALDLELPESITTPQNTYPYESVALAAHFINLENAISPGHRNIREKFFVLASKACCWGVAEPYQAAVNYLITNQIYSHEYGQRLLSLNPEEMLPYAQRHAARHLALSNIAENIGSGLPQGQTPQHFRRLLSRIIFYPDVVPHIELDMRKILHFFETHPEHLSWADEIASQALEGCVNQPLMGWLEICAWVHIAKQPAIIKKLEAAKFLQALSHVKLTIAHHFSDRRMLYPEYVCVLMQKIYYKICSEQVVAESWVGIPDQLWAGYRAPVERSNSMIYEQQKIFEAVKNMTIDDAIETVFMQSAGRAFWARIALPSQLRSYSQEHQKEQHYLEQVILYLSGDSFDDVCEQVRVQGYQPADFEAFLARKCPGYQQKTVAEKMEIVGALYEERQALAQSEEITVNQKALLWTKVQARSAANNLPNIHANRPRAG